MAERAERRVADLRDEAEEEMRQYNGMGQPRVVLGVQLGKVMREWREEWDRKRDPYEQETGRVMGPIDWLKEMTGIHSRRLYGLMNDEFVTVGETQAELILLVMERQHLLSNGTIHVIPNPNWSLEKWTAYMEDQGCI